MSLARRLILGLFLVSVVTAGVAVSRAPEAPSDRLRSARSAAASQNWAGTLSQLTPWEGELKDDDALLAGAALRLRALIGLGRLEEAMQSGQGYLKQLPIEHPGRGRLTFVLAEGLAQGAGMPFAAELWAERAEVAVSEEQRERVAAHYIAVAERLTNPPAPSDPMQRKAEPNWREASKQYAAALQVLTGGEPRLPLSLQYAEAAVKGGAGGEAAQHLERALKRNGLEAAMLLKLRSALTRAYLGNGQMGLARAEARRVLAHPLAGEGEARTAALKLNLGVARRSQNAEQRLAAVELFLAARPEDEASPKIRMERALLLRNLGRLNEAEEAFLAASRESALTAELRSEAAYEAGSAAFERGDYERSRTLDRQFVERFPQDGRVDGALTRIPKALVEKGMQARREERYSDAIAAWRKLIEEAPQHESVPGLAAEIGLMQRRMKRFEDAVATLRAASSRYFKADRRAAGRAGLAVGIVLEEDLQRLEEAIKSYRSVSLNFGDTPSGATARARIKRLERTELELSVPRAFSPGEEAFVRLPSRNVEESTVRIYRVEGAEVFERKGSLNAAEQIEVALVKADHTFVHAPEDYQRYARRDDRIALKSADGKRLSEGTYLVSIEGAERRATALVVVASLRVIVKRMPDQLFFWVVDATSGEPVEGAELLVADGDRRLACTSDAQGVARLAPEGGFQGSPQVVARRSGGALIPVAMPSFREREVEGLAPAAHFTFDRPLYRPSEQLRFSALLRDVQEGAFTAPASDAELRFELLSPSGRRVASGPLKADASGRVTGEVALSEREDDLGWHRMLVRITDGPVFEERVLVQRYQAPDYEVTVKTEDAVVAGGEKLSFDVSARSWFGGKIGKAQVRWQAFHAPLTVDRSAFLSYAWYLQAMKGKTPERPGSGMQAYADGEATLDEDGNCSIELSAKSGDGPVRHLLMVSVRDGEGNFVSGTASYFSGPVDRYAALVSEEKALRVGDRATVRVIVRGLDSSPAAAQGSLVLERRVDAQGAKAVYDRITEIPVSVGENGETTVRVPLTVQGPHRLRFEAEAGEGRRFGHALTLKVAGDKPELEDEILVRFEREAHPAGTDATALLSVPATGRAVLLTFEAEGVLQHRILRPSTQQSALSLRLEERFAPNVTVAVAMPHEHKLLTSKDEIIVLRYLEVGIEPGAESYGPRDEASLNLKVRDQAGQPVEASLALRVTDAALDQLGGKATEDIRFVFNTRRRSHRVATGSSYGWSRTFEAKALDPDLLELESDREDLRARVEVMDGLAAHLSTIEEEAMPMEESEELSAEGRPGSFNSNIDMGGSTGGRFGGGRGGARRSRRSAGGAVPPSPAGRPSLKLANGPIAGGGGGGGGGELFLMELRREQAAGRPASKRAALESQMGRNLLSVVPDADAQGVDSKLADGRQGTVAGLTLALGEALEHDRAAEGHSYAFVESAKVDPVLKPMKAGESWGGASTLGLLMQAANRSEADSELLRTNLSRTAAWFPALQTDAQGEASVRFPLPDTLTRWSVEASGGTQGTAVGRGVARFLSTRELGITFDAPAVVTTRDRFQTAARVNWNGEGEASFAVGFENAADASVRLEGVQQSTVTVGPGSSALVRGTARAVRVGGAGLVARASGAGAKDAVQAETLVIPFGRPIRAVARETLQGPTELRIDPLPQLVPGSLSASLQVRYESSAADLISGVRALIAGPSHCVHEPLDTLLAQALADRALRDAGLPPLLSQELLLSAVDAEVARLRSLRNRDGGFGLLAGRPTRNWVSAHVLASLAQLDAMTSRVDHKLMKALVADARGRLNARIGADERATLLQALVAAGESKGLVEVLQVLHRGRSRLSPWSRARVALAAVGLGRADLARMVVEEELSRLSRQTQSTTPPMRRETKRIWSGGGTGAEGALLEAAARVSLPQARTEFLKARVGRGLRSSGRASTMQLAAIRGLLAADARQLASVAAGKVVVRMGDRILGEGELAAGKPMLNFAVPAEAVAAGEAITVERQGGGEATASLLVQGVVPAERVEAQDGLVSIRRRVLRWRSKAERQARFAPGYSVVREESRPAAPAPEGVAEVAAGDRVLVEIILQAREAVEHLVIEDPAAAGLQAIETSYEGAIVRREERLGRTLLHVQGLGAGELLTLRYAAWAARTGEYAARPASVRSLFDDALFASSASYELAVRDVASGSALGRAEEVTPDQIWARGQAAFEADDYELAMELLDALDRGYDLEDKIREQGLYRLLRSALHTGDLGRAVTWHQRLELRNPGLISLTQTETERLGAAMLAAGDHAGARARFREVVLESVMDEENAVGAYYSIGDRERHYAERLALRWRLPPGEEAADVELALASYALDLRAEDPKLAERDGVAGARWAAALDHRLAAMAAVPGTPMAAEAARQRIGLLAALARPAAVVEEMRSWIERFGADDAMADRMHMQLAELLFLTKGYDEAQSLAEKVWEQKWLQQDGSRAESPLRPAAGFLIGRIAHVRGQTQKAVTWYERVKDEVPDAERSWRFFTAQELEAPTIQRFAQGEAVRMKLRAKNIEELSVRVYPVDLAVLFVVKKRFDALGGADLAGIRPAVALNLPANLDRFRAGEVAFELKGLDAGAYLVVQEGGRLARTTLVLKSDLDLTVQRSDGSLRVYVTDASGQPVEGARVRMSLAGKLRPGGRTDARGLLEVRDPGRGALTVVVEKDSLVGIVRVDG